MKQITYLTLFLLFIASCKNPEADQVVATIPQGEMTTPEGFSNKGIDRETMEILLNQGDHIDYIFNEIIINNILCC